MPREKKKKSVYYKEVSRLSGSHLPESNRETDVRRIHFFVHINIPLSAALVSLCMQSMFLEAADR